jgi:hypothetical protein
LVSSFLDNNSLLFLSLSANKDVSIPDPIKMPANSGIVFLSFILLFSI